MSRARFLLLVIAITCPYSAASASSFSFVGVNGDVTAAMRVTFSADSTFSAGGVRAIIEVENTSPTSFNGADNSPAITGFGFDLLPDNVKLDRWYLEANDNMGTTIRLGDDDSSTSDLGLWSLQKNIAGFKLDFQGGTDDGMNGALFNPSLLPTGPHVGTASGGSFYTTAVLVAYFETTTSMDPATQPFVRFQNMGPKGEDSEKTRGTETDEPPGSGGEIPVPSGLVLLATTFVPAGLLHLIRRKRSAAV